MEEGRKHGALRPQTPLRLIRDGEVRGSGIFISNNYSLHCHHQNGSALCDGVSHFNVSLIMRAKSQESIHKPQFLKRKESRSGSNRGPSAYLPSDLPLGHTSSQVVELWRPLFLFSRVPGSRRPYPVTMISRSKDWKKILAERSLLSP